MITAYYNDCDAFVAQWLRNLIAAGKLTPGDVDERPIQEVAPDDVRGYDRVHWFAGIGGWELALQLAGWEGPCWTGSCPCQPFSQAGKRRGTADERHLWPEFRRLIAECRPSTVFGEQVSGTDGRAWLAGVRADMEGAGYAVGAADLPAACAGAPHKRQRLFFVADANFDGSGTWSEDEESEAWWRSQRSSERLGHELEPRREDGRLGDAIGTRSQKRRGTRAPGADGANSRQAAVATGNLWSDYYVAECADGKTRRIGSGVQPLAYGLRPDLGSDSPGTPSPFRVIRDPRTGRSIGQAPWRVGMLRGYGNAIVPAVAAMFIRAFMECWP